MLHLEHQEIVGTLICKELINKLHLIDQIIVQLCIIQIQTLLECKKNQKKKTQHNHISGSQLLKSKLIQVLIQRLLLVQVL